MSIRIFFLSPIRTTVTFDSMFNSSDHVFYYSTTVPTETQQRQGTRTVQWTAPLKKVRCKEIRPNGTRCDVNRVIGAGLCPYHAATVHNVCAIPFEDIDTGVPRLGVFAIFVRHEPPPDGIVFREGAFVLPYEGEVLTLEEKIRRYGESNAPYCIGGPNSDEMGDYDCPFIDGALYRSTASLIKHASSEEANCAYIYNDFEGTLEVRAVRDIYENEELSCDYGDEYIYSGASAGKFDTRRSTHPVPSWFK